MEFNSNFSDDDLRIQVVNDDNSGYGIDFFARKTTDGQQWVLNSGSYVGSLQF